MTEAELDELVADCPTLFHMAEAGAWPSIRRHGLLSTSALLDLFRVQGEAREAVEARRRPESVALTHPEAGAAVIRDNKPIDDVKLNKVLEGGMTPAAWYRLLNARVFFWLSRPKLLNMLEAKSYRGKAHDILEFDAGPLIAAYKNKVTLSAINSGAILFPGTAPRRGPDTFLPIGRYPYAERRRSHSRGERIRELAITGGVPDAERFVGRVVRMQGDREIAVVFER